MFTLIKICIINENNYYEKAYFNPALKIGSLREESGLLFIKGDKVVCIELETFKNFKTEVNKTYTVLAYDSILGRILLEEGESAKNWCLENSFKRIVL